jgi:hypothetical protein
MPCPTCASENQKEFGAEINIHFLGYPNLAKPTVLVFPPRLFVCLDCGFSHFGLSNAELLRLREPY